MRRARLRSRFDMLANLHPSFNTLSSESGKPKCDIRVSVFMVRCNFNYISLFYYVKARALSISIINSMRISVV